MFHGSPKPQIILLLLWCEFDPWWDGEHDCFYLILRIAKGVGRSIDALIEHHGGTVMLKWWMVEGAVGERTLLSRTMDINVQFVGILRFYATDDTRKIAGNSICRFHCPLSVLTAGGFPPNIFPALLWLHVDRIHTVTSCYRLP